MTRTLVSFGHIVASLTLLFSLEACDPGGPSTVTSKHAQDPSHDKQRKPKEVGKTEPEQVCPDTRRIARGCTEVEGWTYTSLLAEGVSADSEAYYDYEKAFSVFLVEGSTHVNSRGPKDHGNQTPAVSSPVEDTLRASFGDYCVYEWAGEGKPDVKAFEANFEEVYPDCMVTPAGLTVAELGTLKDRFKDNLALPHTKGDASIWHGSDVVVAVIDSAPAGPGAQGQGQGPVTSLSMHGMVMQELIKSIIPGADVVRYQALSHTLPTAPSRVFGWQSEVIKAIQQALRDHADKKLIINLSLGWTRPSGEELPLFIRVLEIARCQGALVFAAAGNAQPGCTAEVATFPAAWETRTATCSGTGPGRVETFPLLRAVSAVDEQGIPLPTNCAEAKLAALGRLAVVQIGGRTDGTANYRGPISGTSVATAVTSAIAAGVWARTPGLSAREVIDKVQNTGIEHQTSVSQSMLFADERQRVVSACHAWSGKCAPARAAVEEVIPRAENSAPVACPTAVEFVFPQPEDPPCKDCKIKPPILGGESNGMLELIVDNDYNASEVTEVVLYYRTPTMANNITYTVVQALPNPSVVNPIVFTNAMANVPIGPYPYPSYAYVTMRFNTGMIAGNEILVVQPSR
jgi:hypothetical protein